MSKLCICSIAMLSIYIMFLFCAINQLINKLMLDMKCDLWQFQPTQVP